MKKIRCYHDIKILTCILFILQLTFTLNLFIIECVAENVDILKDHTSSINIIIKSPDGNLLASGSYDDTVKLWDTNTKKLKYTLTEYASWKNLLIFSPDGKTIAYPSKNNTIKVYNTKSGKHLHTLVTDLIIDLLYSPDSQTLASTSSDKTVKLWNLKTGKIKFIFTDYFNPWSNQIIQLPDGKTLACKGNNNTILIWNTQTGKLKHTLLGHTNSVRYLAFSSDGKTLVSASDDKTVKIWNVETGKIESTLTKYHKHCGEKICFSPDGKILACESNDNNILLWDTDNVALKHTLKGHKNSIKSLTFSHDGIFLASISYDETIIWNTKTGLFYQTIRNYNKEPIFFLPDRHILGYKSFDDTIKLWDTQTGKLIVNLRHSEKISSFTYTKDMIAVASGKSIYLWDTRDNQLGNLKKTELQNLPQYIEKLENLASSKLKYPPELRIIDEILSEILSLIDEPELQKWFAELLKSEKMNSYTKLKDLKQPSYLKTLPYELRKTFEKRYQLSMEIQQAKREIEPIQKSLNHWRKYNKSKSLKALNNKRKEVELFENRLKSHIAFVEDNINRLFLTVRTEQLGCKKLLLDPYETPSSNSYNAQISGKNYSRYKEKNKTSLTKTRQPLPYDGLFKRRNNEFGTRMEVGIKDMIDQGVMIEHDQIRFDDFIALNYEQIPLPQSGQALAVSYGLAEIPLLQKPDSQSTHYLEIALKSANTAPRDHVKRKAPSVIYVFVVDISGSMSGNKLDTVKASIRELFQFMRPDDIIGIIAFDDKISTILKTTPKKNISVNELSKVISKLTASGGTDINLGVSFGLDEMFRYEREYGVKQLYLFSDGNPTSGETNWITIRKNIASKTRNGVHISTFAFGSDANNNELNALAGMTGGRHLFVTDLSLVKDVLHEELKRREYLTAINIQLQIEIDRDITILHLYGHDQITDPVERAAILTELEQVKEKAQEEFDVKAQTDLITQEKGIRIFVPDLGVGETYYIVFELALNEKNKINTIGKTTIQYVDTFAKKNKKHVLNLDKKGEIPSEIVVQHGLGLWTSEVVFYALQDLYEEDLETARKRIDKHLKLMADSNIRGKSEQIADDRVSLRKFLSLANNLGKIRAVADVGSGEARGYLLHFLNQFGQSRSGLVRQVNY